MEISTQQKEQDRDLILALGGPQKVAELLGYELTPANIQKVKNWLTRGIPWHVKALHGDLLKMEAGA